MLYGSRGLLNLARRRAGRDPERTGERGQILILFCLVIVVLMVAASIVVDVGLLRTDAARLQNALDSGAMAAAHDMPANAGNVGAITTKAQAFTTTNYPGLGSPIVSYACLIGLDDATGLPRLTDMPTVCNVSFAANSSSWVCTATLCWAPCDPAAVGTDTCNTVILTDSATQAYSFGRVVGVTSGNTGTRVSAACNGPCGVPPIVPVDVVVLLDRTGSMDGSASVGKLRDGARAVLSAFDPALQRVALGFTGPTSLYRTTDPSYGSNSTSQPLNTCTAPNVVHAVALDPGTTQPGNTPVYGSISRGDNLAAGGTSLTLPKPAGTSNGDFLLATIVVDGGSGANITTLAGWTLVSSKVNSSTNVGVATFRRFAGSSEPANYVWTISNVRAVGSVLRYTGVDTASPIDVTPSGGNSTLNGTAVTATAISTATQNTALVGVYVTDASGTFTTAALTERLDTANPNASGPTLMVATGSQSATGSTGNRVATASVSNKWASQLVALRAVPGPADVYGSNTATDMNEWVPVGFTGTDADAPALGSGGTYNEAYVDSNKAPRAGAHIVQAIGCFDVSSVGTNLAVPLRMARQYLLDHGRPNTLWGVIIETDGTPNYTGAAGANSADFTCSATQAAADALKATSSGNGKPVELFTIGYGLESQPVCPDNASRTTIQLLASAASNSSTTHTTSCDANENTDGDHFFCSPTGGDLSAVLRAAAEQLVAGSRLVQMYGQPVVSSVNPNANGAAGMGVTITGKYFTETYSVTFGGVPATRFTVVGDTQINAVAPTHSDGTVDIQVSSPGGSSRIVNGDHFTYGP